MTSARWGIVFTPPGESGRMNKVILENGTAKQVHRNRLNALLASTQGTVRIAPAYVTDRDLLTRSPKRERRLLLSLMPMDIASGATSLESLGTLVKSGVDCRTLLERPRLHAKVYIFGSSRAVITSANLTRSALDSNIEAGAEISLDRVQQLVAWFDKLWNIASPLTLKRLSELQTETRALRAEYMKLKKKAKTKLRLPETGKQSGKLLDKLQHLFAKANRYFVCNTDRRDGRRTPTGGFVLEQEMLGRGFAAAWESFKFPSHMEQVEAGDAIFMFAKGIGVIAIGVATNRCERLMPDDPDRIRGSAYPQNAIEWRVPVQWLSSTDEAGAYPCKSPNFTFWDISEPQYDDLREGVKEHFLGDTEAA
jgi:hypothetical protein